MGQPAGVIPDLVLRPIVVDIQVRFDPEVLVPHCTVEMPCTLGFDGMAGLATKIVASLYGFIWEIRIPPWLLVKGRV